MSEQVKKIFTVLVIIVACVLVGALVLNVLLPNGTKLMINATEDMIFKATGMTFDLNGDGIAGSAGSKTYTGTQKNDLGEGKTTGVEGFK